MRTTTALILILIVSIVGGSIAYGCYQSVSKVCGRLACVMEQATK